MTSAPIPECARVAEATDAVDHDVDPMPGGTGFERYEYTATEPNIALAAFDEGLDLETRVYTVLFGAMSFGGIGYICLCAGAGLHFLLS